MIYKIRKNLKRDNKTTILLIFIALSVIWQIFLIRNINYSQVQYLEKNRPLVMPDSSSNSPNLNNLPSISQTGRFTISWSAVQSADSYALYRSNTYIHNLTNTIPIYTGTNTNYNESINVNGRYFYTVIAHNGAESSELSNCEYIDINLNSAEAYAILIGISDYPGSENDLNYSDENARGMKNLLMERYAIPKQNIYLLLDENATESMIEQTLLSVKEEMDEDDYLIFAFSGKGTAGSAVAETKSWYINTPHPYPSDYEHTWHYHVPDAKTMRVHFTRLSLNYWSDCWVGDYYDTSSYENWYWNIETSNVYSSWVETDNIYVQLSANGYSAWGIQTDYIEIGASASPYKIIPYDGISDGITPAELDTLLDQIPGKLITYIDASNSGGFGNNLSESGRYIITSCSEDEDSLEDETTENGCFSGQFYTIYNPQFIGTHSAEIDGDQNGGLSFEEIFPTLYNKTINRSTALGSTQHPNEYDEIQGQTILEPTAKIFNCSKGDSFVNITYFQGGLGSGELHGVYYDIPNQTYYKAVENYSVIGDTENQSMIVPYPDNESGFNGTAFSFLISTEYGNLNADANYSIYFANPITKNNAKYIPENFIEGNIKTNFKAEYKTNFETNLDTDGDGLCDIDEFYQCLNPWNPDTDGDGMYDNWEIIFGFNPLDAADRLLDSDEDGLFNQYEFMQNTNPLTNDTDADGLMDQDELTVYGTSPTVADSDGDELNDFDELMLLGTDPNQMDSDGDGIFDGQEVLIYGTNPNLIDSDNDGVSDWDELRWRTNPTNRGSSPWILLILVAVVILSVIFVKYSVPISNSVLNHLNHNSSDYKNKDRNSDMHQIESGQKMITCSVIHVKYNPETMKLYYSMLAESSNQEIESQFLQLKIQAAEIIQPRVEQESISNKDKIVASFRKIAKYGINISKKIIQTMKNTVFRMKQTYIKHIQSKSIKNYIESKKHKKTTDSSNKRIHTKKNQKKFKVYKKTPSDKVGKKGKKFNRSNKETKTLADHFHLDEVEEEEKQNLEIDNEPWFDEDDDWFKEHDQQMQTKQVVAKDYDQNDAKNKEDFF